MGNDWMDSLDLDALEGGGDVVFLTWPGDRDLGKYCAQGPMLGGGSGQAFGDTRAEAIAALRAMRDRMVDGRE